MLLVRADSTGPDVPPFADGGRPDHQLIIPAALSGAGRHRRAYPG